MLGGAGVHIRFIYFSLTVKSERVERKRENL